MIVYLEMCTNIGSKMFFFGSGDFGLGMKKSRGAGQESLLSCVTFGKPTFMTVYTVYSIHQ